MAQLFVGQLPFNKFYPDDFIALFSPFGTVLEHELYIRKGSGFITYGSTDEADAAIQGLHGKVKLHNRSQPLQVMYSKGTCAISAFGLEHQQLCEAERMANNTVSSNNSNNNYNSGGSNNKSQSNKSDSVTNNGSGSQSVSSLLATRSLQPGHAQGFSFLTPSQEDISVEMWLGNKNANSNNDPSSGGRNPNNHALYYLTGGNFNLAPLPTTGPMPVVPAGPTGSGNNFYFGYNELPPQPSPMGAPFLVPYPASTPVQQPPQPPQAQQQQQHPMALLINYGDPRGPMSLESHHNNNMNSINVNNFNANGGVLPYPSLTSSPTPGSVFPPVQTGQSHAHLPLPQLPTVPYTSFSDTIHANNINNNRNSSMNYPQQQQQPNIIFLQLMSNENSLTNNSNTSNNNFQSANHQDACSPSATHNTAALTASSTPPGPKMTTH